MSRANQLMRSRRQKPRSLRLQAEAVHYPTVYVSGGGSGPSLDAAYSAGSARRRASPISSDGTPAHPQYPHPKN